jgi:hypothetical protein
MWFPVPGIDGGFLYWMTLVAGMPDLVNEHERVAEYPVLAVEIWPLSSAQPVRCHLVTPHGSVLLADVESGNDPYQELLHDQLERSAAGGSWQTRTAEANTEPEVVLLAPYSDVRRLARQLFEDPVGFATNNQPITVEFLDRLAGCVNGYARHELPEAGEWVMKMKAQIDSSSSLSKFRMQDLLDTLFLFQRADRFGDTLLESGAANKVAVELRQRLATGQVQFRLDPAGRP